MHPIFTPAIFSKDDVGCPKCNWKGCGSEVHQEELLLTDAIELYCPSCQAYLGFVSTPEDRD